MLETFTCSRCDSDMARLPQSNYVSVNQQGRSLANGFKMSTNPKQVKEYCYNCEEETTFALTTVLQKAPSTLIVSLEHAENDSRLSMPFGDFGLPVEFCEEEVVYGITGMTVRKDTEAGGYMALLKNDGGDWTCIDKEIVYSVGDMQTNGAIPCILFLTRKN
jgi:hypothetical protein